MSEQKIANNKAVYITYEIRDEAGTTVERSDIPIAYVHGDRSPLLKKLEHSLSGHVPGDTLEVMVSPEEGFGYHDPSLTFTDDIGNVPPDVRLVGQEVLFENERGEQRTFKVTRIENGKLTIDGNHPLAGQTVKFIVSVVKVRDATPDEIFKGLPKDAILRPSHYSSPVIDR
jgi:FKBP-type peptidyl-prolyl cis-trans isomerase SlyD